MEESSMLKNELRQKSVICLTIMALSSALSVQVFAADGPSSLKAMNGNWIPDTSLAIESSCPGGEFLMEKFIVKNGNVTGKVGHSRDGPFNFNATIQSDGYVSYFSSGQYVMIGVKGNSRITMAKVTTQYPVKSVALVRGIL
jgi:hypothetical protein